ncbi:unnamed protein product [Adineta steineri]|uniref:Uncharacterized protein n=1 Tax=Adineta steineri TaxID=433720 RepID=A0A813VHY0_9BILA|nr:unnamed protein product [Adineta steineri]CAF0860059.1 unnamed protein product [Adineta steineri]CAF0920615.1 unnamed protein product [Adineta steineri]
MNDKEPLLKNYNKLLNDNDSDNENKSFSDWRQYFNRQKTNAKNKKLDDEIKQTTKDIPINVFQLFRFADRIDILLIIIALCLILIHEVCVLANVILFGRITGLFATTSFAVDCNNRYQNLTSTNINNSVCPLGIDLNPLNYDRLHKLCHYNNKTISSTLSPLTPLFHENVMHLVHWFLGKSIEYDDLNLKKQAICCFCINVGLSILAFLCTSLEYICWTTATKRQTSRMSVLLFQSLIQRLIAKETEEQLNTYSKAGQIAQEVFSSLRTVLSFNGSKYQQKQYDKELKLSEWCTVRKDAAFGAFFGWLFFINFIVYSIGFTFGSILMSYETHRILTISEILVVVNMFAQALSFLNSIGPFFQSISEAQGAAVSVFRLIDEIHDENLNEREILEENISDENSISDINGDIEFDNVNFYYPSRENATALNNLKLIARANQTTALVGSSGCGKSTCVSLLLRYYEPSSGRIMIDGQSITDYKIKQFRQHIGVVSQEPILFGISIYENIRFGKLNATRAEIEQAAEQANAHKFIMKLPNKYETLVGERGIQLSGGEKQRIALARALVKQPNILLLDEATSALDDVSERIVQEALDRACKNRTTIVIAHRLTTIQNADYIYVLDKGSVIEEGTHETLLIKEGGKYQTMVKMQQSEKTIDTQDGLMNMTQAETEDKAQILERARLLSESEATDINQRTSISTREKSVFLRLLKMNSPEWIFILIGCLACLLGGLRGPLFSILLAKIINVSDLFEFNDCKYTDIRRRVSITSGLFILLGAAFMILHFFQFVTFGIAGAKLVSRLRLKAFACLLRQEVAYFDQPENSSGAICTQLSSNAAAIEDMAGSRLGVICEGLSMSTFGFLLGFFYNWELTIIIAIPFVILLIANVMQIRLSSWLKTQSDRIYCQASTLAVEVLTNMRTVKQLSMENEVLRQYSDMIDQVLGMSWRPEALFAAVFGLYWMMDSLILGLLYWRALVLVENNELDMNDIVIISAFGMFALGSIKVAGMLARRIGASFAAAHAFFDLFDRIPTIDNGSNKGQKLTNFSGETEFNQVKFIYPSRPTVLVLNKLQLSIKSGQRIALVGASGCGKSTIIQLLERFYDVTNGQLTLDGIDIRKLNIQWVRSRLGVVSQEPVLFDLTIAENIAYGLENIPMDEIVLAATKANIHEFIQQLPQGYETKVGVKGSFLSGGEKQRVAIARVLIRQPKILLLDEATSAMDPYNERIVQETLEQAQTENSSRTSIIIAHRLSTIRSCDVIHVLVMGRIVESGTHIELIQKRGMYYKMSNAQNNVQ